MIKKLSFAFVMAAVLVVLYWYEFIALEELPIEQSEILKAYDYLPVKDLKMKMTETDPHVFAFTYRSFDGEVVYGQLSYPDAESEKYPVLIGVSAMGRSYVRWWVDTFNNNPTVTQVNKITDIAHSNGYVVASIDARYHGKRKDPERPLRSIMNNLHFFGDKSDYEGMIRDTVLDHRVLLDWIGQQENLNANKIMVAGYSMGGQISLILGSIDARVSKIISIVPPFIDDKTALVAPKNLVSLMGDKPVLLITASDDENASTSENDFLFGLLPGANKERIDFDGGHILPEGYVNRLADQFE
jgi:dienelactone hydrolase